MGLQAKEMEQRKQQFEREQALREENEARLKKLEEDRYSRLKDSARAKALEELIKTHEGLVSETAKATGKAPDANDPIVQKLAQLYAQHEDMQQQIAQSPDGRLPTPATGTGMERPNVASADTSGGALPSVAAPPAPTAGAALQPGPASAAISQPVNAAPAPANTPDTVPGGAAPATVTSPQATATNPAQKQVADITQQAQNTASRLQMGQTDIKSVPDGDLALMATVATGRHPSEIGDMHQHVMNWEAGMQTGNNGLMLDGLNGIFGPQIQAGVGGPSPYGGTITGKKIIGLDPAMSADGRIHPDKIIPRLEVTTDLKGPDGVPLYYHAPMTQNRSILPNDPVTAVSVQGAADHVGQLGTLLTTMDHPDVQAKLQRGASDPRVQAYLDSITKAYQPANPIAVKEAVIQRYMHDHSVDENTAIAKLQQIGYLPYPARLSGAEADYDVAQRISAQEHIPLDQAMERVRQMTHSYSKYSPGSHNVAPAGTGTGMSGPSTGAAIQDTGLPPPDKSGLYMGYTKDAVANLAWRRAIGDPNAFSNLGQSKDVAGKKQMIDNYAAYIQRQAGVSAADAAAATPEFRANLRSFTLQQTRADAIDQGMNKIGKDFTVLQSLTSAGNPDIAPFLNKPLNYLRDKAGGSGPLAAYNLSVRQVALEYERLITGGQLSVAQLHKGAQDDAKEILNGNMNVDQVNGVVQTMRREMENAQSSTHEELDTIRGRFSSLGHGGSAAPAAAPAPTSGTGLSGGTPAPAAAPKKLVYNPATGGFQ